MIPTDNLGRSWACGAVLSALLMPVAACVILLIASGERVPRSRTADRGVVELTVAPTASFDITACPKVTSPSASVARFSLGPLPSVAAVVAPRCRRGVVLARIGGLYGP